MLPKRPASHSMRWRPVVEPAHKRCLHEGKRASMNVDAMRRIDRHAGIPLCAVATVLVRAFDRLRARAARPLRRILFVELSEMGTTVLAQPAMPRAREKLGAEVYFVIFGRNVGSLDLTGDFPPANVFTIRDTSLFHLAR